jgi:hypothetical protein
MSTNSYPPWNTIVMRNAIAINNIGVELLARHCYPEAAQTFEAAHAILEEAAVVILSLESNDDDSSDCDEFSVAVEALSADSYVRAIDRLSNARQNCCIENDASNLTPYLITIVTWNNVTSTCHTHDGPVSRIDYAAGSFASSAASTRLYTFRMEDVEYTSKYNNAGIQEGQDEDITQSVVEYLSDHNAASVQCGLEVSIIIQNHGLAYLCQAAFSANASTTLGLNDPSLSYIIRAIDLLQTATTGACIQDNFELVMRYSISSTGSAALKYWMWNLQAQLQQLNQFWNLLTQHYDNNYLESEKDLLTDAYSKVVQMYQIVIRFREALFQSIYGSSNQHTLYQLDAVSPAA